MSRITVINDEPDFLDLMHEVFSPMGHDVTTIEEVVTSADDLAASRPDLLIIDLRLNASAERLAGWELVVLGRADRRLAHIPIIVCSADHDGAIRHRDEMQVLGDVYLLPKPFGLAELEELVTHLLDRSTAPAAGRRSSADQPGASA